MINFTVNFLSNKDSKQWLLHKHYAKKVPAVIHSFGLYSDNKLIGVCCYGSPANNHNNTLGDFKCIELVRLVINEDLPKNTASYFISRTFKLLESPLVLISYADEGFNHHGYIYQATNWIYTGKGGGVDFYRDNKNKMIHSRIMSDYRLKYPHKNSEEIANDLGWKKEKGTYKFRYFYFLGNKKEKKQMNTELLLKYKIQPYPKGDNKRYDASYKPPTQQKLSCM